MPGTYGHVSARSFGDGARGFSLSARRNHFDEKERSGSEVLEALSANTRQESRYPLDRFLDSLVGRLLFLQRRAESRYAAPFLIYELEPTYLADLTAGSHRPMRSARDSHDRIDPNDFSNRNTNEMFGVIGGVVDDGTRRESKYRFEEPDLIRETPRYTEIGNVANWISTPFRISPGVVEVTSSVDSALPMFSQLIFHLSDTVHGSRADQWFNFYRKDIIE